VAILTEREVRRRPRSRRSFELTEAEQVNVRRALRALHARHGGWHVLARQTGAKPATIAKAASIDSDRRYAPSAGLALRVAQAAGISVDDLLSGAWLREVPCPLCGRKG
jgi:hypothetical protein